MNDGAAAAVPEMWSSKVAALQLSFGLLVPQTLRYMYCLVFFLGENNILLRFRTKNFVDF